MDKRPLLLTLLQTTDSLRPYFMSCFIARHNIGQCNGTGQTQNLRLYHYVVWNRKKTSCEEKIFPFIYFVTIICVHTLEDIGFNTGFVMEVTAKVSYFKWKQAKVSYKNVGIRPKMAAINNI